MFLIKHSENTYIIIKKIIIIIIKKKQCISCLHYKYRQCNSPCARPISLLQNILIQALIRYRLVGLIVGTQAELEVTHVVSCKLDSKVHNTAVLVFLHNHSSSILAAPFIIARLLIGKCVTAVTEKINLKYWQ